MNSQKTEQDHKGFVECVQTNVDVFVFLAGADSDTSDTSSSSSLDEAPSYPDDVSIYFDASRSLEENYSGQVDDCAVTFGASPSDLGECFLPSLSPSSEEEGCLTPRRLDLSLAEDVQQSGDYNEAGNPVEFAVQVVQNIWDGSKKSPIGFALNLTAGLFGHLVGMIHHENVEHEEPEADSTEELDFLGPVENATIAEPDPLDASEFILGGSNRDSNTSAVIWDSDLEEDTSDLVTGRDLKRRLDISIEVEECPSLDENALSRRSRSLSVDSFSHGEHWITLL